MSEFIMKETFFVSQYMYCENKCFPCCNQYIEALLGVEGSQQGFSRLL